MYRDLLACAADTYDLLVIGGGIHGLFAAYDAAARGLTVLLLERDDFGGGLSANHQRTIHGGLRALEQLHLGRVREQIAERNVWAHIAPHLIRPLSFAMGTYGSGTRSRLTVAAGFGAYNLLARATDSVPARLRLPRARTVSAADAVRVFPGVDAAGLNGAAIWHDYQTVHPDRLNVVVATAARQAGATLINYAHVTAPLRDGANVVGAHVTDMLTGDTLDVRAAVTLVAAGAGLASLAESFGIRHAPPLVRAMDLLFECTPPERALAARGPSGRMLTVVPWHERSLVGTFQSDAVVAPNDTTATVSAVERAITETQVTFPALGADRSSLRLVHQGLTPAAVTGARANLLPDARLLVPGTDTPSGLYALVGVKFTTARRAAADAIDAMAREAGWRVPASQTARTVLPHAGEVDGAELARDIAATSARLSLENVEHLIGWYGTEAPAVARFAREHGLLEPLAEGTPVLRGEVAYAIEHTQAVRLSDAALRRTALGVAGPPPSGSLEAAAAIMGDRLGWDAERQAAEMAEVWNRYASAIAP
jgi:glycerol-3-phosphate dehydrogenase